MCVETDFLTALVEEEDLLRESAVQALQDRGDICTSVLAYAEVLVLVLFSIGEQATYEIDAPRAVVDLLELVHIQRNTRRQLSPLQPFSRSIN